MIRIILLNFVMRPIFAFWGLILIAVLANPVPQKNFKNLFSLNDLTEMDQAPLGLEFDVASPAIDSKSFVYNSANSDFPSQEPLYAANPESDDSSDRLTYAMTDDILYREDTKKRSLFQRASVCPAKFSPKIRYPTSWQIEPKVKVRTPTLEYPCAAHRTKQVLLTCGGPKIPQGSQTNVMNCVAGMTFFRNCFHKQTDLLTKIIYRNRNKNRRATRVSNHMERCPVLLFCS